MEPSGYQNEKRPYLNIAARMLGLDNSDELPEGLRAMLDNVADRSLDDRNVMDDEFVVSLVIEVYEISRTLGQADLLTTGIDAPEDLDAEDVSFEDHPYIEESNIPNYSEGD